MPSHSRKDQLGLFGGAQHGMPPPVVQPWRSVPADAWADVPPAAAELERHGPDLLRRNLQFLRALERHAEETTARGAGPFRELHEELVRRLVRWQAGGERSSENARLTLDAIQGLANLRHRILEALDPERLRKVLAAEPRMRVRDNEVERLLDIAEFQLAEARGEVVEIPIGPAEPTDDFGPIEAIGFGAVEEIARTLMRGARAEQEHQPLPPRGGLATLLRELPVAWLDAIRKALAPPSAAPRKRKEREREIAAMLLDEETLSRIVADGLSEGERQLLAYVLDRGGSAPVAALLRLFGSDRDDGWFWDEDPPTSTLGRVRLHGLVFVGVTAEGPPTRTAIVPRELVEGLDAALAAAGVEAPEQSEAEAEAPRDMRPDVFEALRTAFPDGVVGPVWDDDDLDETRPKPGPELAMLRGAQILYERTVDLGVRLPIGDDGSLEFLDAADSLLEPEQAYDLLFLSPTSEGFEFEIRGDVIDEHGQRRPTTGTGCIGFAVAVSTLAPFAVVRVTSLDVEEGLGVIPPHIEVRHFADEGGLQQPEGPFFLSMLDEGPATRLGELRETIVATLNASGIAVLTEDDLRQLVPWLAVGEEVLSGTEGEIPTVEDAFFFRHC